MKKRIFTNIAEISAAIILSSCIITGCSVGNKPSEIGDIAYETLRNQLKNELNNKDYAIDEITDFSSDTADITQEENEAIAAQFSGRTSVRKYRCSFTSTSINRGIVGTYDLIYAYANNEWIFVSGAPVNIENWIYSAKDVVSTKQIRDDLLTIDIPDLNGGKIGSESDTEIEISERQSDITNGNESMKISVTYNANFAVYKLNIRAQYQFIDGNWKMTSYAVDDQGFWQIDFNDGMRPNEPKTEYIINELSNSANYRNYMMNLSYVDNYYVTKSSETIRGNELTYNYVLIVTYDVFGDIEYNVDKKYVWINNSWQEGDLSISVKSPDWNKMVGTWASTNGDFLRVKSIDAQKLVGTYTHKYSDGNYVTYAVTGDIDIELKDNGWDLIITQDKIVAGSEEEHFVILPFKLDLENDVIVSNGNIYIAKGDEDGGSGLHLGDNTHMNEREDEDMQLEHEDDFDSGLHFFEDEYEDITEYSEDD